MNQHTKAQFVAKAQAIHGVGRYNYSQAVYVKNYSKLIILCPMHGAFEQQPSRHLCGQGCPTCAREKIKARATTAAAQFVAKAQAAHGTAYDYSQAIYKTAIKKVTILCSKHGAFEQTPQMHLSGQGCRRCGKERLSSSRSKGTAEFVKQAQAVHGDLYGYENAQYKSGRSHVEINCPRHGPFTQRAINHLDGRGCRACGVKRNRQSWIDKANGRPGVLYFIRLFNDSEQFYKVGVTYKTVKARYSGYLAGGYRYEILATHTSTNAQRIYEWEQSILETFAHLRYQPKQSFIGVSECFRSAEEILSIFPL